MILCAHVDFFFSNNKPVLYLSGLQQLMKADDDQQPKARQKDVHEDTEREEEEKEAREKKR